MISITANTSIFLAVKPVDFRCQIDGLAALCIKEFDVNPRSGTLYVFTNRAKTMIRVLVYDQGGYWLMTKRLSKNKYKGWPTSGTPTLSPLAARELMQLITKGEFQPLMQATSKKIS